MCIVVSAYMCSAFNLRARQIAVFVETRDHEIWLDFLRVFMVVPCRSSVKFVEG